MDCLVELVKNRGSFSITHPWATQTLTNNYSNQAASILASREFILSHFVLCTMYLP